MRRKSTNYFTRNSRRLKAEKELDDKMNKDVKRIEKNIESLWKEFGTLVFSNIDDLAMFLEEDKPYQVWYALHVLNNKNRLCWLSKNGENYIDYIPF